MTLRDLLGCFLAWCVIVLIGVCAIIASNHQKPIEIANASSGAWDFNDAQFRYPPVPWTLTTQCNVTSRNLPLRQPERTA